MNEVGIELDATIEKEFNSNPLLLEVKKISQNFDYPLFKDIDLTLHEQESIAIVGVSGCGKSTLLNIFSSLLKPLNGQVLYKNNDIYKLSNKDLIRIRRDEFGIIFQSHYLFRGFNSIENLKISEFLSGESIDYKLLEKLKINHILGQGIGEISGGQQQRLSIARVLNKKPNIIFADEPTGNLDNATAKEVMEVVFDYILQENAGIILVTHEMNIANYCNKIYTLTDMKLKRIK